MCQIYACQRKARSTQQCFVLLFYDRIRARIRSFILLFCSPKIPQQTLFRVPNQCHGYRFLTIRSPSKQYYLTSQKRTQRIGHMYVFSPRDQKFAKTKKKRRSKVRSTRKYSNFSRLSGGQSDCSYRYRDILSGWNKETKIQSKSVLYIRPPRSSRYIYLMS